MARPSACRLSGLSRVDARARVHRPWHPAVPGLPVRPPGGPGDAGHARPPRSAGAAARRHRGEAPGRTLLGPDQEAWLFGSLRRSQQAGTAWRLLGQQILFAPLSPTGTAPQNVDVWDGYPAARARVFDFLEQEKISDLAVLTGDIHSSWAMDVPRNPFRGYTARTGAGSLAVELVTPAVSSPPSSPAPACVTRGAAATGRPPPEVSGGRQPRLRAAGYRSQGD